MNNEWKIWVIGCANVITLLLSCVTVKSVIAKSSSIKKKLFLFHIHYKKNEWLDKKNYEWLIRVNKRPFWKAKWAYKLHIFSRVKRVKKYATSKAIWPWKKAVYSQGSTIHSFECTKSFMNFKMNVEHECLYFSKVLWNQFDPKKVI